MAKGGVEDVAVLEVDRGGEDDEEEAERVDDEVTLSLLDLRARVVASRSPLG